MKDIYETGVVPKDFCNSKIVTLPKKNKANSCTDFRTLRLTPPHLIKMIYWRIHNKANQYLGNDQYGFRKQKGTREAILRLRILIEKQISRNKITYLAFIDIKKSFDNINW